MIRRGLALSAGAAAGALSAHWALRRAARRLLDAPRAGRDEASLRPALDALGGEVVRVVSRDGLRLSARWLPAQPVDGDPWRPDPREAVLVLHGWSGSVAPDLVEYAPFLCKTANVLGLDLRGHGESDPSPTTFGAHEVDDVAGALAWLGERGIRSVALFATSMGAVVALASVVVLGDGSHPGADADPFAPVIPDAPPRPRICAVIADSAPPEIAGAVATRIRAPFARLVADRIVSAAARELGADPRETEPIRVVGLVAPVPMLLVNGDADPFVPVGDARRLAAAAGPGTDHWVIAGAPHARGHSVAPAAYEERVGSFLRGAFAGAREAAGILAAGGGSIPAVAPATEP